MRRNHKRVVDLSKVKWAKMKPAGRRLRIQALKGLGLMRDRVTLTKASKEVGLTTETFKDHIKAAIFKTKGRWRAKKVDRIERQMQINERGKVKSIVVTNLKDASIIGKYHNDVKKALETGNEKILRKYKRYVIKDSKGKMHRLETRLNKIYEIEDAKEEPELFEIYEV